MLEVLKQKIAESSFGNIYWYARYLVNTDEYSAVGTNKLPKILATINSIEGHLSNNSLNEKEKFIICKKALLEDILTYSRSGTKTYNGLVNLVERLDLEIKTLNDIIVFCITVKYFIEPINRALDLVPSNDSEYCMSQAKQILDTLDESRVGVIIALWDKVGVKGCLEVERTLIVEEFTKLLSNMKNLGNICHDCTEDNMVYTAFIQEFERRLGQKRKSRGGKSLESVVDFLFQYYNFDSSPAPDHFDTDLEVDKWFRCKDGWFVGISCKRTLRERWKQVSQADKDVLSHHKIKELWHIITYDKDLSDEKITALGSKRHFFYLNENSPIYEHAKNHPGLSDYVRPLSNFIKDIRTETM